MTSRLDDALRAHLDDHAYYHDPQYRHDVELLRRTLHAVDHSLRHRPDEERIAILDILIRGVPEAAEAHQRVRDHETRVRELSTGCERCGNPYTEQRSARTADG